VNVRRATLEDVPVVAEMLDEATVFVQTMGRDQWPVPYPQEKLRASVADGSLYVVEVDGDRAATFTLLLDDPKFWGRRPPDAVYLHKLAVRRAFAGRGLGVRIVDWVCEEAGRLGRAFVRLDCQRDLPGIRQYYERLGFELRGELERGDFAWALYERATRPQASGRVPGTGRVPTGRGREG
jgi:GNAT superfamily N-acetyltransferase